MRFLSFILLFCCCLSAAQAKDLRVAVGPRDKLTAQPAGMYTASLSAFNEDMAREICRRMNRHCDMVYGPMGDILSDVEGGRIDLGFGSFLGTPEREARVDFSVPIWRSSSRLVSTPAAVRQFTQTSGVKPGLATLRDVRVVSIRGSVQQLALQKMADENRLSLVESRTMLDSLDALREGRADFCLLPMLIAYSMMSREAPGQFEFVGDPIVDSGLGGSVHIALPKNRDDLKAAVDKAIAEMRADGTFHRIVRRHFPFSLD